MTGERPAVREAIIAAATTLLHEGGVRALTTRAVADRAGVQAPTIYRLFGDKGGLVDVLAEAAMEAYVAAKPPPGGTHRSPVEALRAAWRRHIDFGLANPELYELISRPGARLRGPATARGIEVLSGLVRAVAAAGLLVVGERRAVEMLHAAGNGAVLTLLAQEPQDRDMGLPDAMLDAVLAAICGRGDAGEAAAADVRASAVQFQTVIPDLDWLSGAERALLTEWLARGVDDRRAASS